VRELGNLIERLSIVSAGSVVDVMNLPSKYRPPEDWRFEEPAASAPTSTQDPDMPEESLTEQAALALLESGAAPAGPREVAATGLSTLPPDGLDLREHLHGIERALVRQALIRADGVVAHAARLLNLRRTTLVERLRKLGLLDAMAGSATEV